MVEQHVTLRFSLVTGEVKIEAIGFKGSNCINATKFLADCLGDCTDFKLKKEYYEAGLQDCENIAFNSNLCG